MGSKRVANKNSTIQQVLTMEAITSSKLLLDVDLDMTQREPCSFAKQRDMPFRMKRIRNQHSVVHSILSEDDFKGSCNIL